MLENGQHLEYNNLGAVGVKTPRVGSPATCMSLQVFAHLKVTALFNFPYWNYIITGGNWQGILTGFWNFNYLYSFLSCYILYLHLLLSNMGA